MTNDSEDLLFIKELVQLFGDFTRCPDSRLSDIIIYDILLLASIIDDERIEQKESIVTIVTS
ncbi:hypothetical protein ELQ35_15225 [Peribacillus cavernae]|uniref:Uncharacterized protein n=1 Tax=Peribacillus cavernae TaxID=1674310 RepID=A0A433HGT8_9BACI|nr:hypothetical protein [Peribacillus cavernae]MDQ0221102.1 hypothetical protein [Peribacillus cavernae]RUQ27606.1 hypothetical protein ELQ35_15225 [Peribacillus cavernae]